MADKSILEQFQALKTHADKCAFFNVPENFKILAAIYRPHSFPKPQTAPETVLETTETTN